jgi:hypothetical protein
LAWPPFPDLARSMRRRLISSLRSAIPMFAMSSLCTRLATSEKHQQRCPERRLQVTGRTAASTRRAVRVSRPDATPIISVEEHRPGCRGEWWTNDVLHTPITAEFIHAARVAFTVASGCARAMGETRDDMFSHRSTMPPPPSYVMVSDVPSQREAVSK